MLSSFITYILVEYGSKRLKKVFQPLLVVGILFHVMCHLLMCLVTLSPVEKVRVLEKRESDRNRFTTYFGEVYIKIQEVSFLKAVLVGLAPSFLSYWFFMYLLDILINTQVHIVILFFLIFLMISLFFSANLSRTDLAIIPEAFDNAKINPLYQLLLIFLSGLITWHLIRTYNLQLPHEIFMYLIIAGFYLLLKYGFKLTRYILSSINTERHKPSPPPKRRLKSYSRLKYNPFKKLKKKKSTVKRSYLKNYWKLKEKDSFRAENVITPTDKYMEQLDKKSEFKNDTLNKILSNEIVEMKLPEESQINTTSSKKNIVINIPHFREKIIETIKKINSQIDCTPIQKELINLNSIEILDDCITRAKDNEFKLPKEINVRLLVSVIIYTSIISNKNMPRISMIRISEIAKVNPNALRFNYQKYFKNSYKKSEFLLSVYRLGRIRNYISWLFFEKLKSDIDCKTSELVTSLKINVLRNVNLPTDLTYEDIKTLREIIAKYQEKFIKYFSDLVEIVRNIIISSITHKKVNALLSLNSLVAFLKERNINLLQRGKFYNSVDNIFRFLREKSPDFFPLRWGDRENLPKEEKEKRDREYRRIISSKLKLYILKNIYNGKYYEDSIIKCPECLKEGLENNINSLRLKALDCHHDSDEKENIFKSDNLYLLFNENRGNPTILEDLINLLESENIVILCRNHHRRLHFNNEFDYIINYKDIFTLPSELIHLLIKVSIDSFRLTKNLNPNEKANKKKNIIRKLKKKYIIENFYGKYCHICGEFSVEKDLSAFDFHHKYEDSSNIKAHELFDTYSCSEIKKILVSEIGGYMCTNCHTVIQYKLMHLLNDIYEDKAIVKNIINDYKFVQNKLITMDNIKGVSIRNIFEKSVHINESYERYLTAIYEISKDKNKITISDLADYTGYDERTIHKFFKKDSELIRQSIEIKTYGPPNPTFFILKEKGKHYISLINHFKKYFSSL